jgi:hypothetical protein
VVDFSFNLEKFNLIAGEIALHISSQIEFYGVDLLYACNVMNLDSYNPKKLLSTISVLRGSLERTSDICDRFNGFTSGFSSVFSSGLNFTESCELKKIQHVSTLEKVYYYPAFVKPFDGINIFYKFFEKLNISEIERFLTEMAAADKSVFDKPLLLPWLKNKSIEDYSAAINRALSGTRIILMVNEYDLELDDDLYMDSVSNLPSNISVGIQNTYIGSDILSHLSKADYSLIILSENIVRNLQMFKDRIQIINGLKVFADQIGIPLAAVNVSNEEEFHIIKDIMISYVAGDFFDRLD